MAGVTEVWPTYEDNAGRRLRGGDVLRAEAADSGGGECDCCGPGAPGLVRTHNLDDDTSSGAHFRGWEENRLLGDLRDRNEAYLLSSEDSTLLSPACRIQGHQDVLESGEESESLLGHENPGYHYYDRASLSRSPPPPSGIFYPSSYPIEYRACASSSVSGRSTQTTPWTPLEDLPGMPDLLPWHTPGVFVQQVGKLLELGGTGPDTEYMVVFD